MSNRKFPEYEDDPTMVGPSMNLGHHPANTDPFEAQQGNVVSSVDLSGEATMVVDGPDLSSEATMVHDSLANPLALLAKLLVQDGVQQGKEYPLLGAEISFGREKDNTISHPDLSVSRRHFKIHYKGDKFILEDLGSSSGTLLNNKRVKGTSKLQHGDRIQVGKTLLEFQMLDESAQGRPGGGGGNNALVALMILVLVLGGGGFGAYTYLKKQKKVVKVKPPTPTAPRMSPEEVAAKKQIQKGDSLRAEGKLFQAKTQLERAKQLAPAGSITRLMADQTLKDTIADIRVQNLLKKGEARYSQGEYNDAIKIAKEAESALSSSSLFEDRAYGLTYKIRLRLGGKDIKSELKRANTLYRRRKYKEAQTLLAKLERAITPGSDNSKTLIVLMNKVQKKLRPVSVAVARPRRRRRRRRTSPGKRPNPRTVTPPAVPNTPPPPPPTVSQGLLFFKRGNLSGATAAFTKEGKAGKAKQVKLFTTKYMEGRSAYAVRNPSLAIPNLLRAYELDANISGGKSIYSRQIRPMLANMFYAKGRQKLSLRNFNGYAGAYTQFRQAMRYLRNHSSSRSGIARLQTLAKGWLARAKTLGKGNQARRLLRNVQRVVSRNDKIYKDAEALLKKISG